MPPPPPASLRLQAALRLGPRHGQREREARAFAGGAGGLDAPAHEGREPPADGEPEPGAAVLAGRRGVAELEVAEETFGRGAVEPDAGVGHFQPPEVAVAD